MEHIGAIEKRLWKLADSLRANSSFASNEYFMPVMGLIFLRHAYSRFLKARNEIIPTLPSRGGRTRKLTKNDFASRGAIFLREEAQFNYLVNLPERRSASKAVIHAMRMIEEDYEDLAGVLPKPEYNELDDDVLRQVLRIFNDPDLEKANGDVFGRIYEYFLTEFADQKAHDNGEFFTPISIVQTIVNMIEPTRGKVIDPACGSGGMFVQSAHFVEAMKANPNENLTFYGMEKNPTTIRLAKMNLAVHGLEGNIQKAISYYEDPHKIQGPFDYVMANPPFNVDEIDAEKIKDDPRLSFGLPGVNNGGKVSNGNYVWISLFHSYLSDQGRAGIVMSSQASSSGGQEARVREAFIKSGDVDIMLAIRSNFFYTRTVPCELWFFDRAKPKRLRDKVLMLDARHIFRKVTRKIYDFSPEQMHNLAAIVWLYRGEKKRFTGLVQEYLSTARSEAQSAEFAELSDAYSKAEKYFKQHADTAELKASINKLKTNAETFANNVSNLPKPSASITGLNATRTEMNTAVNQAKTLIKGIDDLSKLAQKAQAATVDAGESAAQSKKLLDAITKAQVPLTGSLGENLTPTGSLKRFCYFENQADWLLSRFPEGKLRDVEGLVKLVDHKELAANDYSLTPGRYVGVAPEKDDEGFDFKEEIKEIHNEIKALNNESVKLARTISKNFEALIK